MTGELTVGSLFSGIGGLELGLERAGMRVVWQVEKDDYCRRVLAKHWPEVERFEDVKDVGVHNLKPADLICGGFPCQDISYAGQGAGLSGARSGLWYEYARIVGELGPRFIVVENVTALLTRGLDAVLGTLAALGYDAEWECVSAASVGALHIRDRLFIVAYPPGEWGRARGPRRPAGEGEDRQGEPTQVLADAASGRFQQQRWAEPCPVLSGGEVSGSKRGGSGSRGSAWLPEPAVGRVANGVPKRVDRLRALGNAVVPQVAEYIGRLIVEADKEMRGAA